MLIKIGDTVLCHGDTRTQDGDAIGPRDLRITDSPGVVKREYIGETRIRPEDVRVHSGTVTFSVERIFATTAAATEYALVTLLAEETEGAFTCGGNEVFANAAVTNRTAAQVGCAVAVSYTIEG